MAHTTHTEGSCPLSQQDLIDRYFMEHRNQVLAIAAFMDRMDRSTDQNAGDEFRFAALKKAIRELTSGDFGRTERVQLLLSDLDTTLLDERDQQGAYGASIRQEVEQ
jgi:hypothetical protein